MNVSDLYSLSGAVLAEVEDWMNVVSERDETDSGLAVVYVETVDQLGDEVQHVSEVCLVNATGRVQHKHHVRPLHATCSTYQ